MRAFVSDVWQFLWARTGHPIARRERAGWSYIRIWRGLRQGCLPIVIVFALVGGGCCLLMFLPLLLEDPAGEPAMFYRALIALGLAVIGVFYTGEIVLAATGLTATILTSTSISAEIEADTYSLMRLTLIPPREIVLAKFGAAVRELRRPVVAVMATRTLLLIALPLLITSAIAYGVATAPSSSVGVPPGSAPGNAIVPFNEITPIISSSLLALASLIGAGAISLIYFYTQPMIEIALYGAVGMAASSMTRTRTGGLFAGFGLRVGLWAASYVLWQVISTILSVGISAFVSLTAFQPLQNSFANNPTLVIVFYAALIAGSQITIAGTEIGATLGLLRLAVSRAERLPFNT